MKERSCVSCRKKTDKSHFIRIVKTPEDTVVIDVSGKTDGRGAYICRDIECLNAARKKNSLSRALRIKIDSSVYDELHKVISNE